jgi:predicted PurR-regulated permease PerM
MPEAGADEQPSRWRRFFKRWGFALFIPVVAILFRDVLLPFLFAIVVAYILAPVVNRLARVRLGKRTMPRGAAVLLCYVVLLASIGLFVGAFLPRLSGDIARLGSEGPRLWDRINDEWTPRLAHWLEERVPSLVPEDKGEIAPPVDVIVGEPPPPPGTVFTMTPLPSGDYALQLVGHGVEVDHLDEHRFVLRPHVEQPPRRLQDVLRDRLMKWVVGLEGQLGDVIRFGSALITGAIEMIMKLVLVLMVAAFILIDLDRLHSFARGVIPIRHRPDYDLIVTGIDHGLNGVIRGQLIICLVNGLFTFAGLVIFDVKYSLLLSMVAGIMSLIPIFGSILSTIPIVALALVSTEHGVDLPKAVMILLWILGIHFIEANILNPKIIGGSAKMHPVLVVFSLIAGEHTFGLVGALFAVPVASMIQTLFIYFRKQAWKTESPTGGITGPQMVVPLTVPPPDPPAVG